MGERYWEVDAIRGLALAGMIVFHLISLMVILHMTITTDVYLYLCQYIHLGTSIFVLISGVALVLRHGRMEGKPKKEYYRAIAKRGLQVFLIGLAIAVVGSILIYFVVGDGRYMFFNFLQMMGVSMILSIPFLRFGKWNIIPAVLCILLGFFLETVRGPLWLMVFGILPGDYYPRDFFPIFPWLGIMLLGIAIGAVVYPGGKRKFTIADPGRIGRMFAFVGKYPLEIYLLHIPVLFAVLWVIMTVTHLLGVPWGYL